MWKIDHNNLSTGLKLERSSFSKGERIWGTGQLNSVGNSGDLHRHTHWRSFYNFLPVTNTKQVFYDTEMLL